MDKKVGVNMGDMNQLNMDISNQQMTVLLLKNAQIGKCKINIKREDNNDYNIKPRATYESFLKNWICIQNLLLDCSLCRRYRKFC